MGPLRSLFLNLDDAASGFVEAMDVVALLGFAVAILGAVRLFRDLGEATARYTENRDQCAFETPEVFLRGELKVERWLRWLGPLPGVFVTIGILGTFLGLGKAVADAIPALESSRGGANPESVRVALSSLLGSVKFKFQTSGIGIVYSLVALFAVTLYETLVAGVITRKAVMLRPLQRRPGLETVLRLEQVIQKGFDRLEKNLAPSVSQLGESALRFGKDTAAFRTTVEALTQTVTAFAKESQNSAAKLQEASERLTRLNADIDASLQRIGKILAASGNAQLQELSKGLGDLKSQQAKHVSAQAELMNKLEKHQTEAAQSLKSLAATIGLFKDQLGRLMDIMDNARAQAARPSATPAAPPAPRSALSPTQTHSGKPYL